jgi:hypothetical protein
VVVSEREFLGVQVVLGEHVDAGSEPIP